MEHALLRIGLIAVAVVAGVWITRARFGSKVKRRRDDDRGDTAEVIATLPRGPKPRSGTAALEEPDDER